MSSAGDWYDRHVLPHLIDLACGVKPVRRERERIVPRARGEVLEVGIGSGHNLQYYDRARVQRLVAIEPGETLRRMARRRARRAGLELELLATPAESLAFGDASFDTVVLTYTLCSVADPAAALHQLRRVLRPGGALLFCEHGLAPEASVRRWQARLTPLWSRLAGGCHLDRDVRALLGTAGFALREIETRYLRGPRPLTYHYSGVAVPA